MGNHAIYVIKYTSRVPYGEWVSHDESRIHGYSEPKEFQSYYVASSAEIAETHWRYWNKYSDEGRQTTFVSIEQLARACILLELR